jgi:hypothetical protein
VLARLGVESVQEESGRRVVDHAPAVDLTVRHALAVVVPHAALVTSRVRLAIGPQRFARPGVDRGESTPLSGNGVEDSVGVYRSGAEDVVHGGTEVVSAPDPRDLEFLEIGGVDLVERQKTRVPRVAADIAPLALRRAALRSDRRKRLECTEHGGDS